MRKSRTWAKLAPSQEGVRMSQGFSFAALLHLLQISKTYKSPTCFAKLMSANPRMQFPGTRERAKRLHFGH